MLMYVINYGKVLDWMASPKICLYIMIAPILIALFIWYQYHSERPYVNLAPLYQPKAIIGYFYMMLVMFFSTSTTLLTSYLTSILKVDSTHTYSLYTYLLPGYVLGGVHLFLVVPVATLAVSFLDSGRNELFRPVLREPLFRDLTG